MTEKKKKVLSLQEKSDIINLLEQGHGVTNLAKSFGIAKSTICAIKKKKIAIQSRVQNTYCGPGKCKTLRASELPRMEQKLYEWFIEMRSKNIQISGLMLKTKAMEINNNIKEYKLDFTASQGWLHNFKKRFGIRLNKISRESHHQQQVSVKPFPQRLAAKITELGISTDQLYSAHESGLLWKQLPVETLGCSNETSALGSYMEKQRLTFLCCSNATGTHKLKLLVIGKAEDSLSFRDYNCPANYINSDTSSMTSAIFYDWFHSMFVPEITDFLEQQKLPVKALLLLNSESTHPSENELISEDGNICAMFLPPKNTSITKPMDPNIFKILKLHYRYSLLTSIATTEADRQQFLQKMNIKDAIRLLDIAWSKIKKEMLLSSWNKVLNQGSNEVEKDGDISLNEKFRAQITELEEVTAQLLHDLNPQVDVSRFLVTEWNENLAEDSIECKQFEIKHEIDDNSTDYYMNDTEKEVSAVQAVEAFDTILVWAKNQGLDPSDMQVLGRLRENAVLQMSIRKET